MRYTARLLCTVLSLSTMPAAANVRSTIDGASACYQIHTPVNQAYCAGATPMSFVTDEVEDDSDD